jgi:ABC-type sugar transport system permease subunit
LLNRTEFVYLHSTDGFAGHGLDLAINYKHQIQTIMRTIFNLGGPVNVLLRDLGIIGQYDSVPFFTDPTLAKITIICINMWIGIPFTMLSTTGILQNIPGELYEAAKIDGANYLRIFWSVIFPNVKPCVLTLVLFAFQSIWATIPTGTIFNESLKTLPTVMSTIGAGGIARSGASMAATVIMMIPPIVVYLFSQSSIKETMGSAGIKG